MNIFQIKCKPHGKDRLNEFIAENFLSIGWPFIGNLEGVEKEEIRERLLNVDKYKKRYSKNNRTVSVDLGNIWAFVNLMKPGDIVLFQGHQNNVHIVEVKSYEYIQEFDNSEGMCHQRKFSPLAIVLFEELNSKLQELMRNRGTITRFKYPLEDAELDSLIGSQPDTLRKEQEVSLQPVPEKVIKQALEELYSALHSEDLDKRFRAAIEILRYTKNKG